MCLKNKVMIFSIFLSSQMVEAKFFVEPLASWQNGIISLKYKASLPVIGGQSDRATANGPGVGLAFGIKLDKLIFGAEGSLYQLDYKLESMSSSMKANQTILLGTFGVEFQEKYRGYISAGTMTAEVDGVVKSTEKGSAAKLGIMYRHHKWASASAEYMTYSMMDSTSNNVTTKYSDIYDRYYYDAVQFTLRIPFDF